MEGEPLGERLGRVWNARDDAGRVARRPDGASLALAVGADAFITTAHADTQEAVSMVPQYGAPSDYQAPAGAARGTRDPARRRGTPAGGRREGAPASPSRAAVVPATGGARRGVGMLAG